MCARDGGSITATPSGDAHVFERELSTGLYGRIFLREDPMRIEVNNKVNLTRATISLIHELLHMGEELLKDPLPHKRLHWVAMALFSSARDLFVGTEQPLPAIEALVADAFRYAGLNASRDRVRTWARFIQREVAPTVRRYREVRRERGG